MIDGRTKKRGVDCVASDYKCDCHESQVMRGHNFVADWWTGASSPDSHTNSYHTHEKCSESESKRESENKSKSKGKGKSESKREQDQRTQERKQERMQKQMQKPTRE